MKKILVLSSILLLSACSEESVTALPETAPESQPIPAQTQNVALPTSSDFISEAYVQPLIPGQTTTAAYMHIHNNTNQPVMITGVYSDFFTRSELHSTITENGIVKMQAMNEVLLPPNEELVLQPGGMHIMLIDAKQTFNADTLVPICVQFKTGAEDCLNVPVKDKRGEFASEAHIH